MATTSISPVGMLGFSSPAARRRTLPLTATTNSGRAASALAMRVAGELLIEHDLGDAGAVAEVEEDEVAVVAAAVDPAHEDDVFAGLFGAEISAHVGAGEVAKEV